MAKKADGSELTRRSAVGLAALGLAGLTSKPAAAAPSGGAALAPPKDPGLLRLSSVVTPQDGGLYDALLPAFSAASGIRVSLATGEAVFEPARQGATDVVLSHFGHHDLQAFFEDGLAEFPQAVFFNILALLGPAADPAKVREAPDLVTAFKRIAMTKSAYVVNDTDGIKYLSEFLWEASGNPDKDGWYTEPQGRGPAAVALAAQKGGYTVWGLTPFLRTSRQSGNSGLMPLFLKDPLQHRIMVTTAVRADRVAGVNVAAVEAFQQFLITPKTQAMIQNFRLPGIADQIWFPAGRNNSGAVMRIGNG